MGTDLELLPSWLLTRGVMMALRGGGMLEPADPIGFCVISRKMSWRPGSSEDCGKEVGGCYSCYDGKL